MKNFQPKDKHATTVTNSATFQVAARDQRFSRTSPKQSIRPNPRREHVRMIDQDESSVIPSEDGILYEHCFTISDTRPHTAHASPTVPDKGHFVLLDLKTPDSNHTIQVPFQIDSAASCNTLPSKHLSSMPWATVISTRTVIIPYASRPIQPIGQTTIEACKNNTTCNLTFQIVDTDQPALLSTEASKTLGVLTLDANFIRKCDTATPLSHPAADPSTCNYSAAGPSPIPPDTSKRSWPQLGTLTMEFISKNCPTLFQGLGFLGPPVDFDLDPNVKPIHAPVHRQPTSKLESIKTALDTHETTGQLVRLSQPTDWISNMVVRKRESTPSKAGKMGICLDPSQTNKAIRRPKYIIPTLEENLHKLHDMNSMTVIDVKEAFQNIPLTLRSSLMTTMYTGGQDYRLAYLQHLKSGNAESIWSLKASKSSASLMTS